MSASHDPPIVVLHVDDEPDFTALVSTVLERSNDQLDIVTATNAQDGLEMLGTTTVDCVVSDHDMPGMNGLEFLAAVREENPELPFILFTGKGSEEIASDAISAGVTDYLEKKRGTEQYELLANRIQNAVEQHRAATDAATMKQRLRELTRNTNDVLWMFTADWEELLFVNERFEDIYGLSRESAQDDATAFLDAIHPEDRDRVEAAMQRLSNGESVDLEYRVNETEDFGRWVWVQAEPIYEDGRVARVVGFSRDVTERTARERRLEDEQAFTESLFASIPDIFYTLDANGAFLRWNDRVLEVTGYDDDEVEAMDPMSFFPAEHRAEIRAAIGEVFERGHAKVEAEILTKDGDRIPYELTGARLTGPDGDLRGIVGIGRDITERKQREQALEEFAGVVSHDLRNPLSTAKGYLQLAADEGDAEYFERVEHSLERMDRIISDVLWISREGRGIGSTETVSLHDAVQDAWRVVADEDTTAELDIDADLGTVEADTDRLAQLLENLLRNAIEHGSTDERDAPPRDDALDHGTSATETTSDSGATTIRVSRTPEGFAVEDDGPGIPVADRERVFEHGFTTRDNGTGFGLRIVEDIVDAHGWTITVDDGPLGGARFAISTS